MTKSEVTGAYPTKRRFQGSSQSFSSSLVSVHHFLSISALENNNWASLPEPFKGLSLPSENRLTAGREENLAVWLCILVHNRAVALNLENPSGALSRLTELSQKLRSHPWSFSLHHDNPPCRLWHISPTAPKNLQPLHLHGARRFTLCRTTRLI